MFYFYLATIHAAQRLIARSEVGSPSPRWRRACRWRGFRLPKTSGSLRPGMS